MKLLKVKSGGTGVVFADGVERDISLQLVESAKPGNYVIVHAGFAIQVMDEEAAEETLSLLKKMSESDR